MNSKTEKLPQGLRKANACGGGVRPEQRTLFVEAISNEAGNLTREGGNPLALAMGRMSNQQRSRHDNYNHAQHRIIDYPQRGLVQRRWTFLALVAARLQRRRKLGGTAQCSLHERYK